MIWHNYVTILVNDFHYYFYKCEAQNLNDLLYDNIYILHHAWIQLYLFLGLILWNKKPKELQHSISLVKH